MALGITRVQENFIREAYSDAALHATGGLPPMYINPETRDIELKDLWGDRKDRFFGQALATVYNYYRTLKGVAERGRTTRVVIEYWCARHNVRIIREATHFREMSCSKTKRMIEVEGKYGRPLEDLLPDLIKTNGLTATAKELGVSKAIIPFWLLKMGVQVERKAVVQYSV